MKTDHFLITAAFVLLLVGAGCQKAPPSAPKTPPIVPPATTTTSATILVSTKETTQYCNGDAMDREGYRATITEEKTISLPNSQSENERVKSIIVAATTGMCQSVMESLNITVENGTVHIPSIEGWAGVSIAMCSCVPQVEVNALHIPGIQQVIWASSP